MKYETYSEYDSRHTTLAESAFLTLWATLGEWHGDLVLVGGLVPKFLCGDLTHTLRHYDGGAAAAFAAFAEEVRIGNPACPDALRSLREHFRSETSPGPVKASHFVLGHALTGESEDTRFLRTTLRQDMVDAAALLLKAAAA